MLRFFALISLLSSHYLIDGQQQNLSTWLIQSHDTIFVNPVPLLVHGKIPQHLTGRFIGVGPSCPTETITNLYDTRGTLTSWNLNGDLNIASYQSSLIPSFPLDSSNLQNQRPPVSYEKTNPPFSSSGGRPRSNDRTNQNLYHQRGSRTLLLLNQHLPVNTIDLDSFKSLGSLPRDQRDHLAELIDPHLTDEEMNDLSLTSSEPCEYIHPRTGEVYLIKSLLLPLDNSSSSLLYLLAVSADGTRQVIGYSLLPFLPAHSPGLIVIDDYVLLTVHPIELDFDLLSSTACFSCSLRSELHTLPSHLFVFSLLTLSQAHLMEELDFYPLRHIELFPPPPLSSSSPPAAPFFVTQLINGWVDLVTNNDYPEDEILTAEICLITNHKQLEERFGGGPPPGNLENLLRGSESAADLTMACDEIQRIEIAVPSRRLPRHVYQTVKTPFYLEPTHELLSSTTLTGHGRDLHSIVMNPLAQGRNHCFLYALSSGEGIAHSVSSSPDRPHHADRVIKVDLCVSETETPIITSSADDIALHDNFQMRTIVAGTFLDQKVFFGPLLFVPHESHEEKKSRRLRPKEEGEEVIAEAAGSLLFVTRAKADGKTALNILNAQTMELEAVVEGFSDMAYQWKEIFVLDEDLLTRERGEGGAREHVTEARS
jgi:hypothetical protein